MSDAENPAVELLVRYARAAHESGGYPATDLEPRIAELAQALRLEEVQVSVMPTAVQITVGAVPDQQVYGLRVYPRPVDLYAISRLDDIADSIAQGRLEPRRALRELDELARDPARRRPDWAIVAASALVGAGVAIIRDGGWRESVGAAAVGLFVGLLRIAIKDERSAALLTPLGAFVAGFLASALADAGFRISVVDVTIAGLVMMLPGMTMVVGMRELATGHLQSGLSNTASAVVQFIGLAFGVAVASSLATNWLGETPSYSPVPLPRGIEIPAAALVGLAFAVTLRAPARDAIWTCSASLFAVVVQSLATTYLGSVAGVFMAALLLGLAGNLAGRRSHRSRLAFIVPGVLMLVPGSMGYESAADLMGGGTIAGVERASDMLVSILAISYGLIASTLTLRQKPRKSQRPKPESP
jgi:uncharacterized membrane protein YjjP (DUF1212 family)